MPKDTFRNLAADKRDRLMAIALEEFAGRDYDSASVSRVVARAGIAKGSIYQYFTDKKDLYLYLVDEAGRVLLEEITGSHPVEQTDVFCVIRWQMSATIRAAATHPLHARLLERAYRADLPFADELKDNADRTGQGHFLPLLQAAAQRGELNNRIEPDTAAFMVQAVTGQLGHYLTRSLGLPPGVPGGTSFARDDVELVFDQVIDALRNGLGQPGS